MLPIFRLIPVGGVLLAIAILLLALDPPRETSPSVRAALQPVRGALIDRAEHPEWRQFLILAALRRAGEVQRLRDLHDTVIRVAPPPAPEVVTFAPVAEATRTVAAKPGLAASKADEAKMEEPKPAEAAETGATLAEKVPAPDELATVEPKIAEAKPLEVKPVEPKSVEPKSPDTMIAEAAPSEAEPAIAKPATVAAPIAVKPETAEPAPVAATATEIKAPEIKIAELDAPDLKISAAKIAALKSPEPGMTAAAPIAAAAAEVAAPVAAKPEREARARVAVKPQNEMPAPTQVASIAPPDEAAPPAAAPSAPIAPAPRVETNGSRIGSEVLAPAGSTAEKTPVMDKVAAVPATSTASDGDITGAIGPAANNNTIPVGIGEASSVEIEVTLPRERPPALRRLNRRARQSAVDHVRSRTRQAAASKTKSADEQPQFDLFALLFKALAEDFKPIKPTIPYRPNDTFQ